MCDNCLFCTTPNKVKGLVMSFLLVGCAITTSVLTWTTNCEKVIHFANNQTQTINDIGTGNKIVSVSLLAFSVASAVFERYINKKLINTETENEELKSELAVSRQNNNNSHYQESNYGNEPYNIKALATPSPITPMETGRSEYPNAVRFR